MTRRLDYNATVSQRVDVSPGLSIFRVVPDDPLFDFTPGQYTVLGMRRDASRIEASDPEPEEKAQRNPDEMIRRAYSIASSSQEKEYIEFYITLVRSGELTPRLFHLPIGGRLYLGPKATGLFTLDKVHDEKHVLLIATGTGLAPYVSMVRTQLHDYPQRLFVVVHGARHSWDLAYRDELRSLQRYCPNLRYIPSITDGKTDFTWKGNIGRIQTLFENNIVNKEVPIEITPDQFNVFLCGNPAMIEGMIHLLEEKGFQKDSRNQPGQIHVEEYW
ncbi:MAG: ferredoxin--NADP reductase [bacterium]|jgi:ferredoxin--NADP+ reductase|nr:ferredoxin--NADP reductase [bacterium]